LKLIKNKKKRIEMKIEKT